MVVGRVPDFAAVVSGTRFTLERALELRASQLTGRVVQVKAVTENEILCEEKDGDKAAFSVKYVMLVIHCL